MDKYSGCNIVESVVAAAPVPHKEKKKRNVKGFFVRLAVAAVCVGVIAAVRFIPIAAFEQVRSVLYDVFCYDFFGRGGLGSMPILKSIGV